MVPRLRLTPREARGLLLLLGAVFVGLYIQIYRLDISPANAYMGLTYGPRWDGVTFLCLGLGQMPLLWLPLQVRRPSQMVLWFLYLMVTLPVCITPPLTGKFDHHILLLTALSISGAFALLGAMGRMPLPEPRRLRLSDRQFTEVMVVLFCAFFLGCILLFGIRLQIPTLAEIYGLREEFSQQFAGYGRLPGYVVQWFGKALTIFLFVFGLTRGRKTLVALAVVGQLYIFSLLAEKALFFSFFFVFLVMFMLSRERNFFGFRLLLGTTGLMLVGHLQTAIFGSGLIHFMSIRRLMVTPGVNTAYFFEYYSYFSEKVHYAYNLLGRLVPTTQQYLHDYSPARMVGMSYVTYSEDFVINLNVNLWGEGFSDGGLAGVLLATLILGTTLWLFDGAARNLSLRTSAGILAAGVVGLVDGSLYTQLMTNGLLLLLVLVYLMPRDKEMEMLNGVAAS